MAAPTPLNVDVLRAMRIAREAFATGVWSSVTARERMRILRRWADLIEADRGSLATALRAEIRKPLSEARTVDVPSLVRAIRWAAERLPDLDELSGDPDRFVRVRPVGSAAVIAQWNYPLSAVGYNVAPALAVGNSVLVKPSEKAEEAIDRVVGLAHDAGVPRAALQVVRGREEIGEAPGRSMLVDVVTVTGAPETGRAFQAYAAESNGKPVWTELGGKTLCVLLDASALTTTAVDRIAGAITLNAGQICTGIGIMLIHASLYEEFMRRLDKAFDAIGPLELIDKESAEALRRQMGAYGFEAPDEGPWVTPTAIPVDISKVGEYKEMFGPVALIAAYNSDEELFDAIAKVDTGMAATIWGRDSHTVNGLLDRFHVGTIWINCWEADDMTVPSGGVRWSGFGKTKGMRPFDRFTYQTTVWHGRSQP